MANNKNKKETLLYRDLDTQKAEHYGVTNSFLAPFATMFFNISSFFGTMFAHLGGRDRDTMDRADADKDVANKSRSDIYEKAYPEAVKSIEKIAQDKSIGFKDPVTNLDDFIAVAKEMSKGTDEKKEGGFTKGVYEKLIALKEAKDQLDPNDKKSLKEYHDILADVSDSLYEYQNTHNPWRSKGQKRKEFAKTLGDLFEKELMAIEEENPFLDAENLEKEEDEVKKESAVVKEKLDTKEIFKSSDKFILKKQEKDELSDMKEKDSDLTIPM